MELWQALQEELNRLYEMFVERNPYFESNGGKVSIVAHSLGCVVTYDILTGWTQDVEHTWYNLQTAGPNGPQGGPDHNKRMNPHHQQHPHHRRYNNNNIMAPAQSGLLFRIENFFCLGSPLSVFLTLRWRDPQNQEYHDHILPRSLCKYLYNLYHPCDPVAYRVEPIFMKFYSQVEPIHLHGATDPDKIPYGEQPLRPLQAARKAEEKIADGVSVLPVNIANGSINISMGKMAAGIGNQAANLPKLTSMSPSLSLPKMPAVPGLATMTAGTTGAVGGASAATASATAAAASATAVVGDTVGQVGHVAGEVVGGLWGLMKDAANVTSDTVTHLANNRIPITTTPYAGTSTTNTMTNNGHPSYYPSPHQEVKLPDGQRLAYRMDYILKETGNTYIAAITSHTAYWSNPEVAYFMLTKLHPDIEHFNDPQIRPLDPSIHQGLA